MPERRRRTLVPPKRAWARREGAQFQESFKIRPHGASPKALTPRKKSSEVTDIFGLGIWYRITDSRALRSPAPSDFVAFTRNVSHAVSP